MSNEEMDRAYREDYALERDCRDAVRSLRAVLSHERKFNPDREATIREAISLCQNTADHIVQVWD